MKFVSKMSLVLLYVTLWLRTGWQKKVNYIICKSKKNLDIHPKTPQLKNC